LRTRFWIESTISASSSALFLLTLFWRDWIEALTGFDPDHRSGLLEIAVAAALLAITLTSGHLARRDRRQDLKGRLQLAQHYGDTK